MNDEIAPEIAALLENTEEIEPITSFSASAVVQQDDQNETDSASLKPTAPWAPVNLMSFFPMPTLPKFLTTLHIIKHLYRAKKKALSACIMFCPNI